MKSVALALIAAFSLAAVVPAKAAPGDIFPAGATPEKIWGEGRFTEGVDVAPDGRVYFSDMAVGAGAKPPQTLRYDPKTRTISVVLADNGNSNGQKIGPDGRLWGVQTSAGGTRDVRAAALDGTSRQVIASTYGGQPFNALNDIAFDAAGRAWLTDVRYVGTEPIKQPLNGVYRIENDGRVTLAVSDMLAPNGIAFSPDGRTLYIAEHPYRAKNLLEGDFTMLPMSVRAYDVTAEGQAIHGRMFVEFGVKEGVDGMTVDAAGNLVTTYRDDERRGIRVFSPQGREIDFLPMPEKPTNVAFGRGAEENVLYVTAGKSLYRVVSNTKGARR
ncbi:MAG: SMP-30/gluconolactonase/LRE family protein [Casimicrobium sp.]